MEILLLAVFIAVIVAGAALKKRLPDKPRIIITVLSGTFLLVWFWLIMDGQIYWKIIVTVVVIGGLIPVFRSVRNNPED